MNKPKAPEDIRAEELIARARAKGILPKIEPTREWSESRIEKEGVTEIGAGVPQIPIRLGEHPVRYHNWKSQFEGWTQREEEIAHAAYIAGWYNRCNQDPDAMT